MLSTSCYGPPTQVESTSSTSNRPGAACPCTTATSHPIPGIHHARRWLILGVLGHGPADGRARRDDREHRAALARSRTSASPTTSRQWIVTAYALAFGSLLLLGGRLGDLFGRKRDLHRRPARLRRRLRHRRRRARASACWSRARAAAGRVRRAARARRAVAADHDVHRPERARQGVRHLRRDRRRRRARSACCSAASSPSTCPGAGACTSTCSSPSRPRSPRSSLLRQPAPRPRARSSTSRARSPRTAGLFASSTASRNAETARLGRAR